MLKCRLGLHPWEIIITGSLVIRGCPYCDIAQLGYFGWHTLKGTSFKKEKECAVCYGTGLEMKKYREGES